MEPLTQAELLNVGAALTGRLFNNDDVGTKNETTAAAVQAKTRIADMLKALTAFKDTRAMLHQVNIGFDSVKRLLDKQIAPLFPTRLLGHRINETKGKSSHAVQGGSSHSLDFSITSWTKFSGEAIDRVMKSNLTSALQSGKVFVDARWAQSVVEHLGSVSRNLEAMRIASDTFHVQVGSKFADSNAKERKKYARASSAALQALGELLHTTLAPFEKAQVKERARLRNVWAVSQENARTVSFDNMAGLQAALAGCAVRTCIIVASLTSLGGFMDANRFRHPWRSKEQVQVGLRVITTCLVEADLLDPSMETPDMKFMFSMVSQWYGMNRESTDPDVRSFVRRIPGVTPGIARTLFSIAGLADQILSFTAGTLEFQFMYSMLTSRVMNVLAAGFGLRSTNLVVQMFASNVTNGFKMTVLRAMRLQPDSVTSNAMFMLRRAVRWAAGLPPPAGSAA